MEEESSSAFLKKDHSILKIRVGRVQQTTHSHSDMRNEIFSKVVQKGEPNILHHFQKFQ
jgi:hypothetical protein